MRHHAHGYEASNLNIVKCHLLTILSSRSCRPTDIAQPRQLGNTLIVAEWCFSLLAPLGCILYNEIECVQRLNSFVAKINLFSIEFAPKHKYTALIHGATHIEITNCASSKSAGRTGFLLLWLPWMRPDTGGQISRTH